jgi:hypothetical protein
VSALALVAWGGLSSVAAAQSASGCRFLSAGSAVNVAFCDTFNQATPNPATRSGDLNSTLWGVSRTNTAVDMGQGRYNEFYPAHLVGCGGTQTVLPPNDVRICNGRVLEAVSDHGGQPILALYPKQPFDFAGRTGTVVFDVSADSEGPHAAWPEFWLTDKPVPAPHAGELAAQAPYARHSFGFSLASTCGGSGTGVDRISVTRNYASADIPFTSTGCVSRGSATGALNHFELRLSVNRAEIWASDAGSSDVRMIAYADNLRLSFTRGLVWIEHVSYNACKSDNQCDHTFAWDNVGFDGPKTYRDLSFDVPDANVSVNGGRRLGWPLGQGQAPVSLTVPGVYRNQTPTGAIVTFNWFPYQREVPSFRVNGGPVHSVAWPFDGATFAWRTIDVPVPLSEVRDGTNTIQFGSTGQAVLSNVNLILIAGAPVPGTSPTPTPTPAPAPTPLPPAPGVHTTYGNNGAPWSITRTAIRRIQAENFDQGGEGVAYHDTDASNNGGQYRSGGVDIESSADGGGYNTAWVNAGEWLDFTVEVATAGTYDITLRTARQPSGPSLVRVLVGGVDKTGDMMVPSTGAWQQWTNVTKTRATLSAGRQVLRVYMSGGLFNLNWIEIKPV